MLARIATCALTGVEAQLVHVEADVVPAGMPAFALVGLPDAAVKEAGERVRAAIRNSGLVFPYHRIVVNLAPADLRKEGPGYDLPIAVGILVGSGQLPPGAGEGALFAGELALDGALRHVRGVLPMAAYAREHGLRRLFVPAGDAEEAALVPGLEVIAVAHLVALVEHLTGQRCLPAHVPGPLEPADELAGQDFAEVRGQEHVRRALEIAAAGGHNVLMVGPPGAGKTLMARTLPSILPVLSLDEALAVTRIYSVADALPAGQPLIRRRPFRAPHHSISLAGLIGGGRIPRPGEISLAHCGVLFLDELPEFTRPALEALRQPLEASRTVAIARANGSATYPAGFMLVAAMNPCPCGWRGDAAKACVCSEVAVTNYRKRLSGPLLDRIDLHVEVARVPPDKLLDLRPGEPSAAIRARVEAARARQRARLAPGGHVPGGHALANAEMGAAEVRQHCALDEAGRSLLRAALAQLGLSARAYHRVLKLARTIADLGGAERIQTVHLAEALQYRPRNLR